MSPFRPFLLPPPRVCSRNRRLLPSYAPRGGKISPILSTLRILPVVTGVYPDPFRPSRHALNAVSPSVCLPRLGRGGKPHILSSLPPLVFSCLSFSHSLPLFSIACSLFYKNTRGWGIPRNLPFGINNFQALFFRSVCNSVTPTTEDPGHRERGQEYVRALASARLCRYRGRRARKCGHGWLTTDRGSCGSPR